MMIRISLTERERALLVVAMQLGLLSCYDDWMPDDWDEDDINDFEAAVDKMRVSAEP